MVNRLVFIVIYATCRFSKKWLISLCSRVNFDVDDDDDDDDDDDSAALFLLCIEDAGQIMVPRRVPPYQFKEYTCIRILNIW